MVSWAWLVFAFIGGAIFGIFLMAFAAVSRQEDEKGKKWWENG